jgi:CelD/BcsL family acetyltransferase involved in cellulose biosynthesis
VDLRVVERRGLTDLEQLKTHWDALLAGAKCRAYYNDWRWHWAIARYLVADGIYYFLVFDGDEVVAIIPLQSCHRARFGLRTTTLEFPDNPHISLCDAIVHRDYAEAPILDVLTAFLRNAKTIHWHRILLNRFTERSNLFGLCRSASIEIEPRSASYYLTMLENGTSSTFVSRKQLRNVRRFERLAEKKHGSMEISFLNTRDTLDKGFEQFSSLEASGWKGSFGSAIELNPWLKEFYRQIVSSFGSSDQACIPILKLGGHPVAAQLTLRSENVLYLIRIGYDERYEDVAPGNILLKNVLDHFSHDVDEVNLVTSPLWADRWHVATDRTFLVDFYNSTRYSWILSFLRRTHWKSRNVFRRNSATAVRKR